MKLLITGATGYLGRSLCRRAVERWRAGKHEIYGSFARSPEAVRHGVPIHLDLRQPGASARRLRELGPDTIVHAAAVNRSGAEGEMEAVNAGGSRTVAEAATELGARLVHVSTDVVHDGRAAPYTDDAPPAPIGLYARTKAEAEAEVLSTLPSAAIVRTSLIYGFERLDHGTASFVERLEAGEPVHLFADAFRQPVWVETLAEALLRLAETRHEGFFNVAGSQVLSRDEFGRKMLDWWRIPRRERVETVRVSELGLDVPLDLRLDLDRARRELGLDLPGVDEVLGRNSSGLTPISEA